MSQQRRSFVGPVVSPRVRRVVALAIVVAGAGCAQPSLLPRGASHTTAVRTSQEAPQLPSRADLLARGVADLEAGRADRAADYFRYVLKYDPQDASAHLALAAVYDEQARAGDRAMRDLAEVGYRQALEFDPRSWFAGYRLGLLELDEHRYAEAVSLLSAAALVRRDDPTVLNVLAAALYYSGRTAAARAVIERALAVAPEQPRLLRNAALIAGAEGDFARAEAWRAQLPAGDASSAFVARRLADWRFEYARAPSAAPVVAAAPAAADTAHKRLAPAARSPFLVSGSAEALTTLMSPLPVPAPGAKAQMVQVDVVLIRTQEIETASRGVNLLEGLKLQFGGGDQRTVTDTKGAAVPDGSQDISRIVTRQITFPSVNYSLNIANNGYDRADVLARPTLVALDGQPAHFFSGEELSLAVSGQFSGNIIDKKVGVELAVTPTLLDDNTVLLSVNATRSFLNTSFLPEATSALRTTQQRVTTSVAVQLGQTVVLSGLSEHQVEESKVGVPVLQELPGVQYFFSQRDHLVFEKSTLVLLTPRRVGAVTQNESGAYEASGFDVMASYFPELQRRANTLEQIGREFKTNALRHLLDLDDMKTGDVFDRKGVFVRLGHQLRTVMAF